MLARMRWGLGLGCVGSVTVGLVMVVRGAASVPTEISPRATAAPNGTPRVSAPAQTEPDFSPSQPGISLNIERDTARRPRLPVVDPARNLRYFIESRGDLVWLQALDAREIGRCADCVALLVGAANTGELTAEAQGQLVRLLVESEDARASFLAISLANIWQGRIETAISPEVTARVLAQHASTPDGLNTMAEAATVMRFPETVHEQLQALWQGREGDLRRWLAQTSIREESMQALASTFTVEVLANAFLDATGDRRVTLANTLARDPRPEVLPAILALSEQLSPNQALALINLFAAAQMQEDRLQQLRRWQVIGAPSAKQAAMAVALLARAGSP